MSPESGDFTIGVEEEYQVVDPETRELRQGALAILHKAKPAAGTVQPELRLSQVEGGTPVCRTLGDVRKEILRLRQEVIAAAESEGAVIAAAGTHPFSRWADQAITPKTRYLVMAQDYQQLAREQTVFGLHVHVGIRDREAAIQTMNRTYRWLTPLIALGANSPFWLGSDTGYASFRTDIWGRWPMSGTPGLFASRAEYDKLIDTLIRTDSIRDETKIYWDVRPSSRYKTLEFRVTDVCTSVDQTVMIAGLVRAIARACHEQAIRGEPVRELRPELLRAAKWRAARHGVDATLIDLEKQRSLPAADAVGNLLAFLRPMLESEGDWPEVSSIVSETLARGTGARRQREVFAATGKLEDVVDAIVTETRAT